MKLSIKILAIVTVLSTLLTAEMKCAPGKCGGSMSSDAKQSVKVLHKGNVTHEAVNIKANEYSCAKCKMDVNALDYATQAIKKNGDTYFFDDMGCMVLWLEKNSEEIVATYVMTLDTHKWIKAEKAYYSRIAPSPMGYGFGAVESSKASLISYDTMKTFMLKGETLRNPAVKKSLLSQ